MHRRELRGRNRLHKLLSQTFGHWPLLSVESKYGPQLLVSPHEYVDSFIVRWGFYESEVFEALSPYCEAGGVYWDIGSNTGQHGISAKFRFPQLDVVCFEPVPALAARILECARLNGIELTVCPVALSNASGTTWMEVTSGNLGMSHVSETRSTRGPALLSPTQTADSLVASGQLRPPNIIKIDVEGSEVSVFEGMTAIFASGTVRAIALEASPDFLESAAHPCRRILDAAGFTFRRLTRTEPTEHNLENFLGVR
jgi:FkbM family methyltransferase